MSRNRKPAFDRLVDSFLEIAEPGSIEGKFVYRREDKPAGNFTCVLDNVRYRVVISPEDLPPPVAQGSFRKDGESREMKPVALSPQET